MQLKVLYIRSHKFKGRADHLKSSWNFKMHLKTGGSDDFVSPGMYLYLAPLPLICTHI